MKKYINDFIDIFNYRNVILFVDLEINLDSLYEKLHSDYVSHLYRFDSVRENRFFYIENADLQDVTINDNWNELFNLIENGYEIYQLKKDSKGFYIDIMDIM